MNDWYDKRWMYEQSFRTPIIARFPKRIKANTESKQMVLNLDIASTVLDYAGVTPYKDIDSKFFRHIMEGKEKSIRDFLYYHYYENGIHNVSPKFGISNGRFKLIRFYDKVNNWDYYDLAKDPNETRNLINEKKYQKKIAIYKSKLKQEIIKLKDEEALVILSN